MSVPRGLSTSLLILAPFLAGCAGVLGQGGSGGTPSGSDAPADTAPRQDSVPAAARDTAPDGETAGGPVPPGDAPPDSVAAPSGPVTITDVDRLEAMGPVYTPYDVPPLLQSGAYLEGLLRATLLPVVERNDLPADEWARFWLLVDAEGRVRDAVLHLTSGHAAFDDAARAAALQLRYRPARRDDRIVPVWVLKRVSLLMG